MKRFNRAIFLPSLLVIAVLLYLAGSHNGALGLLILGALFELAFWIGLFNHPDNGDPS